MARVWDADTGQPVTPALMHSGMVYQVAFSPDGRYLLTPRRRGLRGEAATGYLVAVLPPAPPAVSSGRPASAPTAGRWSPPGRTARRRLWRLDAEQTPVKEWVALTQLLAAHRIDAAGGLTPLPGAELNALWAIDARRQDAGRLRAMPRRHSRAAMPTWRPADAKPPPRSSRPPFTSCPRRSGRAGFWPGGGWPGPTPRTWPRRKPPKRAPTRRPRSMTPPGTAGRGSAGGGPSAIPTAVWTWAATSAGRSTSPPTPSAVPFHTPKEQQVTLRDRVRTAQLRLWVNGVQVHEHPVSRNARPDDDAVRVTLHHSWNTLLAKVVNGTGAHLLYLRITRSRRLMLLGAGRCATALAPRPPLPTHLVFTARGAPLSLKPLPFTAPLPERCVPGGERGPGRFLGLGCGIRSGVSG